MLTNLYFHLSIYRLDNWIRIELFFAHQTSNKVFLKMGKTTYHQAICKVIGIQSQRENLTENHFEFTQVV